MSVQHVMLFGAGPMAQDYAKVLNALKVPFTVFDRGAASARSLSEAIGHDVLTFPFEDVLGTLPPASKAIVAVSVRRMSPIVHYITHNSVKIRI